jgi:TonB dependent receptor/TonB-dependent Receptor Plug Domain
MGKRFVAHRSTLLLSLLAATALAGAAQAQAPAPAPQPANPPAVPATPAAKPKDTTVSAVVVTASRVNLIGTAETASQGSVTQKEVELRPIYRPGQLLETTPGLVVTAHSGEGKANQYLVRGFNLDHGTDIANFIDDMPINRPTNAHGQGYSDVNFFIPEVAAGLDFTKGPYYASVGDFGAVASTHVKIANEIPNQIAVSAGTLGMYNVFAGGTQHFSDDDRLMGAVYYGHLDGPWTHPDDFRKYAGILRYSHGTNNEGWNVTAMYLKDDGNFTTDQPQRAIDEGLITRYGTLDPTDGNSSERASLSAHWAHQTENWKFNASGYFIHSRMTLWNDFTHYLDDPVNGDQEQQDEVRDTSGGQGSATWEQMYGPVQNETVFGIQGRHDEEYIDKRHTFQRSPLDYCSQLTDSSLGAGPDAPAPTTVAQLQSDPRYTYQATALRACNADQVHLTDLGFYMEDTTRWFPWLRTIVGVREEYYMASDHSLVTGFQGSQSQTLFQPKGSLVIGPFFQTEFYLSGGRGFHSDDVRGVFGTVPLEGIPGLAGKTPLLEPAVGEEVGVRTNIIPKLQLQVALFQEDFQSELAYDADAGEDSASAPSRRQGVEFSAQYRPVRWLELNTDLAFSKARYTGGAATLATFGLDGPFIANAPSFIGSFGILLDNLGPWFGGLQWRDLGPYPVSDGEENPQDKGYSEFNVDLGYNINSHLKLQATAFNLLNTKANAAGYYYAARLPGEPVDGVNDMQVHAIEPLSGNLKVTWTF